MHILIYPLIPYTMFTLNLNPAERSMYDCALYHAIDRLDKELTRLSDISPDRELMTKDAILKLDEMDLTLKYLTELREKLHTSS